MYLLSLSLVGRACAVLVVLPAAFKLLIDLADVDPDSLPLYLWGLIMS